MSEADTKKQPAEKPVEKSGKEKAAPASAPAKPKEPGDRPRGSGAIASVALLTLAVAGAGAGGGWYLWSQQKQQQAQVAQALNSLGQRVDQSQASVESSLQQRIDALAGSSRDADQQLSTEQQQLQQSLINLRARLGENTRGWAAAEVEHLLRIANQRVRFAGDLRGAIAALEEADQRLSALNDPGFVPVREAIAGELQTLRNVGPAERDEAAIKLSGLIDTLQQLPLAGPYREEARRAPGQQTEQTESPSARPPITDFKAFAGALWSDIRSLVVIRHHAEGDTPLPLLTPKERFFLYQNLQLKLESARLALLQGDGALYTQSLGEAKGWLDRYFAQDAAATHAAQETLAQLQQVNPKPPLPDISESLNRLTHIEAHRDSTLPAAAGRPAR